MVVLEKIDWRIVVGVGTDEERKSFGCCSVDVGFPIRVIFFCRVVVKVFAFAQEDAESGPCFFGQGKPKG